MCLCVALERHRQAGLCACILAAMVPGSAQRAFASLVMPFAGGASVPPSPE